MIPADAKIDSYKLIDACEKVITFGSTMGIECVFLEKPSILAGRAVYEHLGGVYIPKNHDGFIDLINSYLNPTSIIGALKYGYWQAIRGHLYMYYQPESVRYGKFLGVPIASKPIIPVRVGAKLLQIIPAPVLSLLLIVKYRLEASYIKWRL